MAVVVPSVYIERKTGMYRVMVSGVPVSGYCPSVAQAVSVAALWFVVPHSRMAFDADSRQWYNPELDFSSVPSGCS